MLKKSGPKKEAVLSDFLEIQNISEEGFLFKRNQYGFMFVLDGIDISFFSSEKQSQLNREWRGLLRLEPSEELHLVFRKRVAFSDWIEKQLNQAFLGKNKYGRRILMERLAFQVEKMSRDQPGLINQKIIATYWKSTDHLNKLRQNHETLLESRNLIREQLTAFGFRAECLNRERIKSEIHASIQPLEASECQIKTWPKLEIDPDRIKIDTDYFKALEMVSLPENETHLGMIQSLSSMPYPLDISLRLRGLDQKPIVNHLERKRNLIRGKMHQRPSADLTSQFDQIESILKNLADRAESLFKVSLVCGLRFPANLSIFQKKAISSLRRSGSQLDFAELEETTISTFDSFLECIPGSQGKNIKDHTILGSNAIHFLPFFRPSRGDPNPISTFETRDKSLYGIDPVNPKLANFNWLVSGTSGSGKSFFVNSLLGQSTSIDPNIFIVDIGGSYNKLTQFLGGKLVSLDPSQGFRLSPFFLSKNSDSHSEKLRRQHIQNIFLEMTREQGTLPSIEVRELLFDQIDELLDASRLPSHPITHMVNQLKTINTENSIYLSLLLKPWCKDQFYGQFLDHKESFNLKDQIITFDLKGLNDFNDLARVVQLIICSSLWSKVREAKRRRFSWIVLDEVAFSLLKTQPDFVDELISTIRKYYGGVVIIVQDLEKITSSLAGSSILQNTQTKAILQQRGDPRNYQEALSLNSIDRWAIESLKREKGAYSDIFLIRDDDKVLIRYTPCPLEYWLATTSPHDVSKLQSILTKGHSPFQEKLLHFIKTKKKELSL